MPLVERTHLHFRTHKRRWGSKLPKTAMTMTQFVIEDVRQQRKQIKTLHAKSAQKRCVFKSVSKTNPFPSEIALTWYLQNALDYKKRCGNDGSPATVEVENC